MRYIIYEVESRDELTHHVDHLNKWISNQMASSTFTNVRKQELINWVAIVLSDIDRMAACYAANIRLNLYTLSSQRVESENAAMKSENIASTKTSIYNLTMAEVIRSDKKWSIIIQRCFVPGDISRSRF